MKKRILSFCFVLCLALQFSFASVSLIMPHLSGANGSQVTVPVKVKDFINIVSMQGTIDFNPSVISYTSVQDFGLPGMNSGNFGTTQVSAGKLTFSWFDSGLNPNTLSDSAVVFSITFTVTGSAGQTSTLLFSGTPTAIEIINSSMNPEVVLTVPGSVLVSGAGPSYDLTLYYDTIAGTQGSNVDVSLRALDFININSVQGTIHFDPAVATFSSLLTYGLPGMSSGNFGTTQAGNGKITFSWADLSLEGQDLPDHTPLFTIRFSLTGPQGSNSPLGFATSPTPWEVSDSLFNTLNVDTLAGYMRVELNVGMNEHDDDLMILTNFPNPFNGQTTIAFNPGAGVSYQLTILNVLGECLFSYADIAHEGTNTIQWPQPGPAVSEMPAGLYFCRLEAAGQRTGCMMILE